MPENYVTNQTEKGNISISEDVINVMVTSTVSEIEGVAGLTNPTNTEIADFLGLKNNAKGIKVSSDGNEMTIDLVILVRYGYGVTVVAKKLQEQVAANLESVTGLKTRVNVHVSGISFDRSDMKG
ncbi:MAG: Asp23/Gls24 family envelope stress response protein [Oscillospiraceae bacterium]|nr:Asp23/Gls24 family envelope stress response protein [Oscillospiraceae bacterium]